MTKRLFAMLLVMVMVLSMLPLGVWAEEAGTPASQAEGHSHKVCQGTTACADCAHTDVEYLPWGDEPGQDTSLPTEGKYYLTKDITLKDQVKPSGTTLYLCLNGHSITAASGKRHFNPEKSANLIISNCGETDKGVLTGGQKSSIMNVDNKDNATVIELYNLVMQNNSYIGGSGGALMLQNKSSATLVGCKLLNNYAGTGYGGGAIRLYGSGTLALIGCEVRGNSGVSMSAIRVDNAGTVKLVDTIIEGNTSTYKGEASKGAVYLYKSSAKLIIEGNTIIFGNEDGDGKAADLFLQKNDDGSMPMVSVDKLGDSAKIGVNVTETRLASDPYITNALGGKTYAKYFVANNSGYRIFTEDDKLVMIKPAADGHIHKLCNDPDCTEHEDLYFKPWEKDTSLPTSGNWYLTKDVTMSGNVTSIAPTSTLNLCLNGKTITRTNNERHFDLQAGGAVLSVTDCETDPAKIGQIKGAKRNYGGTVANVNAGSTFNLFEGILTDNHGLGNTYSKGGAVRTLAASGSNPGGTFNMYGGKITNNTSAMDGGAIYGDTGSVVNIYGGEISGNSANGNTSTTGYGGAIYFVGTKLTIENCKINNNSATNQGGAHYSKGGAAIEMTNCELKGNKAKAMSAIRLASGSLKLVGCIIEGNETTATGENSYGAVYVPNAGYQFVVEGETRITGNKDGNGDPSNVYFQHTANNQAVITIGENGLAGNAMIGITMQNGRLKNGGHVITANAAAEGAEQFFTADNAAIYEVIRNGNDGKLYLNDKNHSSHKVCCSADCSDSHENLIWLPWNDTTKLPASGNYYLNTDVTLSGVRVLNTGNLNLCLHGHKVTIDKNERILAVGQADDNAQVCVTASITDCTGNGQITGGVRNYGGAISVNPGSTLNLYGGNIVDNRTLAETGDSAKAGAIYLTLARDGLSGAIFNMYGGSISQNKAYYGGAVFVGAGAQANIYGGTISGNEAYRGGAIYAEKNGIVNIAGGAIKENTATNRAGAIFLSGGTLNLSGGEISGHEAKTAIVAASKAVINMTGGKITGNKGSSGGAIILESVGTKMTMSGGEISGNEANAGGGIFVSTNTAFEMTGGVISGNISTSTGGGLHLLRSTVTLAGGEIKNNTAGTNGGAIEIEGATVTMTGTKITGNQAANGAGMYIAGAKNGEDIYQPTVSLAGGEISGNTASGVGGGVVTKDADFEKLELSGDLVITDNRAGNKTSNLYLPGKAVFTVGAMGENAKVGISAVRVYGAMSQKTDKDCSAAFISDNSALKVIYKDATIYLQPADGHTHCVCLDQDPDCKHAATQFAAWSDPNKLPSTPGNYYLTVDVQLGAVCNVFDDINLCLNGHTITPKKNERTFAVSPGAILSVTDCTDKGVITGGVRNYGGVINVNQGATFNLYGGNLTGNRTVKMDGEAGKAGAVYVTKATEGQPGGVFNMYGGSITQNKTFWGGAIYVCDGATANIYGGTIANNEAMDRGGAICVDGKGVLNISGGTITGNTAAKGGAIYTRNESVINMTGGVISKNSTKTTFFEDKQISKASGGGALALTNKSVMTMTGGEFKDNTAQGAGGAILMESKGTKFVMKGGKFTGNSNTSDGGAIYVSTNTVFEMSGGEITKNTAKKNGGGVYFLRSTGIISGGKINSNISTDGAGGGIGMARATVTIKGGSVSYNTVKTAKSAKGGGIMMNGATLNIYGGSMVGNTLPEKGTGGSAICTSTASETKNGVKTTFYSKINMYGGTISNHTGRYGGALLLQSQTVMNMYGGTLRDNHAVNEGGAVCLYSKSTFNMSGGSIVDNTSEDRGGGLKFNAGTIGNFTGGTATGNTAGKYGGFFNAHGIDAKITMKDMKVYGNECNNYGGAIAITWNAILDMDDCEFYENTGVLGGAMYLAHKTTCDLDNVKIYKNYSGKTGGGVFLDVGNTINFTNVKILDNESVENGGGVYTRANVHFKDCLISGNVSGKDGGAIATSAAWTYGNLPEHTNGYVGRGQGMILENTKIDGNTCVGRGGGAFMAKKNWNTIINSEFTNNTSGETGSALFVGDDLLVNGMTVTGNTSKANGYAVYYRENTYDGQSYMQTVHAMGGNVIVKDNQGGDMFLCEKVTIGNTVEGYGQDTYINVGLSDGVLTNRIFGEYDYEGGDLVYTMTYGSRSYTEPEVDTARVNANKDKTASGDTWLYVGLGAFVAVVAAAVVLLLLKKKKAGKPAEMPQE